MKQSVIAIPGTLDYLLVPLLGEGTLLDKVKRRAAAVKQSLAKSCIKILQHCSELVVFSCTRLYCIISEVTERPRFLPWKFDTSTVILPTRLSPEQ